MNYIKNNVIGVEITHKGIWLNNNNKMRFMTNSDILKYIRRK